MKRRHRFTLPALLALSLIAFSPLRADIIVLKSGERLEGKVISENADSVTLEYRLTPKIKDTKIVPKADIQEMTKLTAAQMEMEERALRRILPTPDLLSPADYEATIQDKLRTFVVKHPNTPEATEGEKIITTLSEEKDRVIAGGLKVQGRWLTADEVKRDAYNIEAYRHRKAMSEKVAELKDDNFVNALREFEIIRTTYPASTHFVELVPEALIMLDNYEKRLVGMAAEQPILTKQRTDGLKILQGTDLQRTKASIDEETKAFKDTYSAQKKAKTKWMDVSKYDAVSIKDATAAVTKERAELKALNLPALQVENNNFTSVLRYIADENATEAELLFSKIPKESVVNKKSYDLITKQLTFLKDTLKKRKAQAAVAAATAAAMKDATAVDAGEGGTNALAELLKKGKTPADGDAATDAKDAANAKPGDAKKTDDKKTAKPKPPGTTATVPPVVEAPPTLLESLSAYFPIIGGVLVLVLILALFMGKKKKKEEA